MRFHWVLPAAALEIHERQLSEHGGLSGIRDERLLESALARPKQLAAYGSPDLAALAASYGYGIARNHPFVDGNKRTAFVVASIFLTINGHKLVADKKDAAETFWQLSDGKRDEADVANWFRRNLIRE